MRKIINGRTYNTETSKVIGTWESNYPRNDFKWCMETLYKNTRGAYFLYGKGGPMSPYTETAGTNTWTGSEKIVPLTKDEAMEWAEKKLEPEEYEAEFGEVEEAESDLTTRERVNLVLDAEIMANLRKLSADIGVPMSRMVDKAILEIYGGQFK